MTNPLQKYFRQPAIYIRLPSEGHFWPEGSIELGTTGDLAVYPMTVRDELIYKTPDALMNGQGTVDVIQSCIPQIKNAWATPSIDLDPIMIAIRIASYGDKLDLDIICPKCREQGTYTVPLTGLLDHIEPPNFGNPVCVDDLEIYLKPQDYYSVTQANIKSYQEQRILNTINDSNLPEDEKMKKFTEMFRELTNMTIAAMSRNIKAVKTDRDIVTDENFILEFLENCSKPVWEAIEKKLAEIAKQITTPDQHVVCSSCEHEFDTPVVFDLSNFFE